MPRRGSLVDDLDQLGDGVPAVADDVPGNALGRPPRRWPSTTRTRWSWPGWQASTITRSDSSYAFSKAVAHLVEGLEVDRYAAAVVAVERLDDDGEAQPHRLFDRLLGVADDRLPGHGQPELIEDLMRQPLVGGDLDGDVAGLAGERRLDALLVLAVAELHQRALVQADPGDVPLLGGAHQGGRRGAEGAALGEAHQALELGPEIERGRIVIGALGRQQVADDAQREIPRRQAHRLLDVAVDDVVLPLRQPLAARLAEGDRRAGEHLQLDGDVLQDVPHPGPLVLFHPPHEAAVLAVGAAVLAEGGDHLQQAVGEPRQLDRGKILQLLEIHPQADDGPEGVEVGTAIDPGLQDFHDAMVSEGDFLVEIAQSFRSKAYARNPFYSPPSSRTDTSP